MTKKKLVLVLWCITALMACQDKSILFEKINANRSGIHFNNVITESDSLNPMSVVNVYNGGGVGVGDFNNDGLPDLYFTGNMVASKLYLNKGDFKFEDITDAADVAGMGRWARGVAVVDINNDGRSDLYVCNTISTDTLQRRNILYVNQGVNEKGIPYFKDMAAEYGLDRHELSTMANFFDYDNDGDLDVYLTVNEASTVNPNKFGKTLNENVKTNKGGKGKLYQNNWNAALNHPVFVDVSARAGIQFDGFGHGATVADINLDGWKDIYVSNDFLSDNLLYINNQNGTFTNRSKEYFKHTSFNAMGQDIIDINNDGLSEVIELDMNPRDNYRKKMMLPSSNYNLIQNFDFYGSQFQYIRNTLQLNQGPRLLENDSVGPPVFSEIGFLSGVAQTDWSWTPLVQDFDNDGFRDIIVTNGFPKDVTDLDFITYRQNAIIGDSPLKLLDKIPEIKLANFAFKNTGGIRFNDVTANWGLSTPSFSNGAAYADLDQDGDMDLVVNNIGDEAFLYENTLRTPNDNEHHFLQVKCVGTPQNKDGIGAWVDIYYNGAHQSYENTPYRGYLSTYQNMAHFGLGQQNTVDSVVVRWPNGKKQTIPNVKADQLLLVNVNDATENYEWQPNELKTPPLFKEITQSAALQFTYQDRDFIDFNIQSTLPHKLSEYRPALAVADLDGNGLDDLVISGNSYAEPSLFLQQANGQFTQRDLTDKKNMLPKNSNDEGVLLFDANGDQRPDLYVVCGGYNFERNSPNYQDRLYINTGDGHFVKDEKALPTNYTSKLCVKALDFNRDGKLDLFVSGRVDPGRYPQPVSSFMYRNDSENGIAKFTDVTSEVAPELNNIGMVSDALFTDFDNDNQLDLIVVGEWMPVCFFKNNQGVFKNISQNSGVNDQPGWWNSIVAGDFRNCGKTDYIIGNVGLNTLYQASDEHPVFVTAKDFDNTGGYVPIASLFLPDTKGAYREFPAMGRDDILKRIPSLRKRFNTYKPFALATMDEIFPADRMKDAQRLKATMLQSCYLRNEGEGRFTIIPLPVEAQFSVMNGMVADDFDADGNLDVLINGNDYSTEVSIGRLDAMNGLLLKGDGNGNFSPLSILQSGIYIPGNGKALVKLMAGNGNYLVAASQFQGPLKLFSLNKNLKNIRINPDDVSAVVQYKNGKTRKEEFYYGSSFLSQSGRFIAVGEHVSTVQITDSQGRTRNIP